jgi:Fur family ferric uptake transcriptional regulator
MKQAVKINREQQAEELLKHNKLSVTDSRKFILSFFLQQKGAVSHGDIEKKAADRFDRVTIYRTLQTFVDRGLVHTIPTADNSIRYGLCKDDCGKGKHRDHHIHFICNKCHQTYCLDDVVTPDIRLPRGYSASHAEVIVEGICKDCR